MPTLLATISDGKRVVRIRKGTAIFAQGDPADAIYFVATGQIKVSVVSPSGKEAVLALLGPHGFFGEGSLVGQTLRISTAVAVTPATLYRVERQAMLGALQDQAEL